MKVKTMVWRMKDDAFPELTPESRETIIGAEKAMCEENAAYGYLQGTRNTLIGVGAGLAGLALVSFTCVKLKLKNDSKKEKKD